jgi:hypothetical protein
MNVHDPWSNEEAQVRGFSRVDDGVRMPKGEIMTILRGKPEFGDVINKPIKRFRSLLLTAVIRSMTLV